MLFFEKDILHVLTSANDEHRKVDEQKEKREQEILRADLSPGKEVYEGKDQRRTRYRKIGNRTAHTATETNSAKGLDTLRDVSSSTRSRRPILPTASRDAAVLLQTRGHKTGKDKQQLSYPIRLLSLLQLHDTYEASGRAT